MPPIDSDRFKLLRDVVVAASDLPEAERRAFLDEACRGDPEVREEAEALLLWEEPPADPPAARPITPLQASAGTADPLRAGSTLGRYRLLEKIGEGGMGVVWRAMDPKLSRTVAIKILPPEVAHDSVRLARFEREAKATAALAHPNILAIHDFGTDGNTAFAVTTLLEGETLDARLRSGPLPPTKAADLAIQIAQGLAAAHSRGIVHRDLKPQNVFLATDGRAVILDFGLAASDDPRTAEDAGEDARLSTPGMVLGTAAYMSPEQARGEAVDRRSDIFSLGILLYESLTGRNPFQKDSAADAMAAVLREDPPAVSSRHISPAMDRVVRKCLEKRPADRFQSALDLAFAIDLAIKAGTGPIPAGGLEVGRPLRQVGWIAAVVAIGFASAAIAPRWMSPTRAPAAPPRVRTLTLSGSDQWPAPSPDGRTIAFSSRRDGLSRIWIKQLSSGGEQPLTAGNDVMPAFSPDGSSLLFVRSEGGTGALYRQGIIGAEARRLTHDVLEAAWSPNGRSIAFLRLLGPERGWRMAIGIADARDGAERVIADLPHRLYGIGWTPDGREIYAIETVPRGVAPEYALVFVDAATGGTRRLALDARATAVSPVIWNGNGRELLFARAGSLVGDQGNALSQLVRRDLRSGAERTLFFAEHLFPSMGAMARPQHFDVLADGSVAFCSFAIRENLREFLVPSRAGALPRRLTLDHGRDRQPCYSPDGRHVLFASNRSGNLDLWLLDEETGALRQITDDAAQDWDPAFSPRGDRILWSSDRGGHLEIWTAAADGSGARQVTRDGFDAQNPTVTPDGQWIVYRSSAPGRQGLWKVHWDGTGSTRFLSGQVGLPEVSPDGRWVSFVEVEPNKLRNVIRVAGLADGRALPYEIVVSAPFDRPEAVNLGRHRWLRDGTGIAFVGLDASGHAAVLERAFSPTLPTGGAEKVLLPSAPDVDAESFGISPDGRRISVAGLETSSHIMLAEGVPGVIRRR